MGVHSYENLNLKKIFNIPVFSPPYICVKTCTNNSTFPEKLHRKLH